MKYDDLDPRAKWLIDCAVNPRLFAYDRIAFWEAWHALAQDGRRPPLMIHWKRDALEKFSAV